MDVPADVPEPWRKFEELVSRILVAYGFSIARHSPRGDRGFDFTGSNGDDQWAIEVKYYRTNRAQPHLIEAAAARVANQSGSDQGYSGMLVVSCLLPPHMRQTLEAKFNINFIDRLNLDVLTADHPLLSEELQSLLGSNLSPFEETAEVPKAIFEPRAGPQNDSDFAEDKRGTALCKTLSSIKSGKKGWSSYEKTSTEILKYLFEDDLEGWKEQPRTDDGLQRFDLACRVKSDKFFWRFIYEKLDSVYVLFEFKNYSEKIKQGQVLTTERYLLERALRRVAFIVTRHGAAADADKMARGAMREHGKLIVILDDEMICKMLRMKEEGDDPTDYLFTMVDGFLLSLSR